MAPLMRLVLPLLVASWSNLEGQLPGVASVRPDAQGDILEVNAKGSLVHIKDQLQIKAANAERSGKPSDGNRTDAQEAASQTLQLQEDDKSGSDDGHGRGKLNLHLKDDLANWISSMITSGVLALLCTLFFELLRTKWIHFPLMFANNTLNGLMSPELKPDYSTPWGFIIGTDAISRDESEAAIGLDNAFLIEYWKMSIQVVIPLTVLYCGLFMPLHYYYGTVMEPFLSKLGMEHLQLRDPVFWVHSGGVWFSVIVVVEITMRWHERFLERRKVWLKALPAPRDTTILVEEIPSYLRSDASLYHYFANLFGEDRIESVVMVKHTQHLVALIQDWRKLQEKKEEAEMTWEVNGGLPQDRPTCLSTDGTTGSAFEKRGVLRETVDMINHYTSLAEECSQQIAKERLRIREEAEVESRETMSLSISSTLIEQLGNRHKSVCTHAGFVTFKTRRDAVMAKMVNCKQNLQELTTNNAPDPGDIRYEDFMVSETNRTLWEIFGYICIAFVFFGFLPIVVMVESLSNINQYKKDNDALADFCTQYPRLENFLEGVISSAALSTLNFLIPTILLTIFNYCFTLRANAWAQATLQIWYFWFMVVFIILSTAVGTDLWATTLLILKRPMEVPLKLATILPYHSHFYLNFTSLRWGSRFLELTRYWQLGKFVTYRYIYKDAEKARELSEPEDQDYYGLGSRCSRGSINLLIPIIYGPMCPLILPVTLVDMILCRYIQGYLINFAETRKPDLGGAFWVQLVKQTFLGLFVFVILMFGVLHSWGERAIQDSDYLTPGTVILPVAVYLVARYRDFVDLEWEMLPFEEAVVEERDVDSKMQRTRDTYEQAELIEELEIKIGEGPSGAASSSATYGSYDLKDTDDPSDPAENADGAQG